jgi:hypothetical protein
MNQSMNVLALIRDGHRYIFLYDDNSVSEVLSRLSASARDTELDFTWYDAAMLSQRARRMADECESESDFGSQSCAA